MFEKEADYIKAKKENKDKITKVISAWSAREETIHDVGFQKGAEFGYNKANEWHYIKDGKYPIDEKDVEVLYRDCDKINVYNCIYDIHAENWLYYNLDNMVLELFPFDIIAWKEIIPPKEY